MIEGTLGRWPVAVEIPVAWGEMDSYGHVNNTVYLRWFETARVAYFLEAGVTSRMESEGVGPILARATIDFRLPLTHPDTVRVGTTVTSLGNTSFVMGYRLTSAAHQGRMAATGEGVIVMVNYRSGKKEPLWDELRQRILRTEAAA